MLKVAFNIIDGCTSGKCHSTGLFQQVRARVQSEFTEEPPASTFNDTPPAVAGLAALFRLTDFLLPWVIDFGAAGGI